MQHPLQVGGEQHTPVQLLDPTHAWKGLWFVPGRFSGGSFPKKCLSTCKRRFKQPSHEKKPQLISQLRGPLCGGATWHVEGWPPRPSTACTEPGEPIHTYQVTTPVLLSPIHPNTFSNWWSEGEPSPQCTAKVDGKSSPTHGSFKIRSTEGKMLGESLHQIWNISNQDAWTLPQHRNSRTAKYVIGPIVRAVGCLSEHDWNTRTDFQQNIQPHNIDQANKIQTSTFQIDGNLISKYINSELNIKICRGASSSKTCPK